MPNIKYKAIFWNWFNATSAASVSGDRNIAGGQAHIALGRCGDEVRDFLKRTPIRQQQRVWRIPLEKFGTLPTFELPIRENAKSNQRSLECRIPSQTPTSRDVYPLWHRVVKPIAPGALPQQVMIIIRDAQDAFHARILSASELSRLPRDAASLIFESRGANRHLSWKAGVLREVTLPAPKPRSQRASAPLSRPANATDRKTDWRKLAAYVGEVENHPRTSRVRYVEQKLRDARVRAQAIHCFGERCQVQNCSCTAALPPQWIIHVVEVHHLQSVAKGGDDSLFNLAVLCANHHRLFENLPGIEILRDNASDDILLYADNEGFLIERDLEPLRQELEKH